MPEARSVVQIATVRHTSRVEQSRRRRGEANAFAKDGLIPRDIWLRSDAYRLGSASSALSLANHLGVHPAIVAGRLRFERRNFRIFSDLVGEGRVRDVVLSGG